MDHNFLFSYIPTFLLFSPLPVSRVTEGAQGECGEEAEGGAGEEGRTGAPGERGRGEGRVQKEEGDSREEED